MKFEELKRQFKSHRSAGMMRTAHHIWPVACRTFVPGNSCQNSGNLWLIPMLTDHLQSRGLKCGQGLNYREDYTKLDIPPSATKEEIKAAYFRKAKKLHPDSTISSARELNSAEFYELNEAYKRLMYESKYGTDQFDVHDPRNDPRNREYWDLRKRSQSQEEITLEEQMNNRNRTKERAIMWRGGIALLLGVFFGTIFPALFLGKEDYADNPFTQGCKCDHCQLKKLEQTPGAAFLRSPGIVRTRSRDPTSCCQDIHSENK